MQSSPASNAVLSASVSPGIYDRVYANHRLATLVRTLATEGVSEMDALRGTSLSIDALSMTGARVSLHDVMTVCRNAMRLSGPHFALRAGKTCNVATFGMFGFALLSSSTFRQAISFALRYHQLVAPLCEVAFSEEDGQGVWSLRPISSPLIDPPLRSFLVDLELASGQTIARNIMGPELAFTEVRVTRAPPADAHLYAVMLDAPVIFGERENQLRFEAGWLERSPRFGNPITHAELAKMCDLLMDEMRLRAGLSGKVREVLLNNVLKPMSLEHVASRLRMSARTLRRRLSQEGTSFSKLADDLRMRLAVRYLDETSLTVRELAHLLGFNDDAAFRQAFRRWTGIPPSEYRARTGVSRIAALRSA